MIICKYVDEYIEYAENHKEWINKERWLLIENVVKPIMQRNDVYFDYDQIENCIRYCEVNYYPLFPYQKFIYSFVFLYEKYTGLPIFRKFFIEMGRGNGKDGFIAPLVNYLQTPLHGIDNYNVDIVANSEDQSEDTYKIVYRAVNTPKLKDKFDITKEELSNKSTGSILRFNTSNAKTKDGKKIGCLVLNELHAYENYKQINVFESAFGKIRHPRTFIITTNGYVRDGPLDETEAAMMEVLTTGQNPLGYFPFICKGSDPKRPGDDDVQHQANPSMEFLPDLERQIKIDYLEALKIPSKMPEYMTKRLNLPARNEEQTVTSWENILRCSYSDIELRIPRIVPNTKGKAAVIAIDYADVRDFASAGRLTMSEDGELVWYQHTWICRRSPFFNSIKFPLENYGQEEFSDFEIVDTPTIPVESIVNWCINQTQEYQVKKITMDTYRWTLFKTAFEIAGLSIEDKKNPNGIVRLIRRLGSAMVLTAPKIERYFSEGLIIYGPSAIMRWYTNNTMIKRDKQGNMMYEKIEPKLRKNDGFMAFVAAMFSEDELKEVVYYV